MFHILSMFNFSKLIFDLPPIARRSNHFDVPYNFNPSRCTFPLSILIDNAGQLNQNIIIIHDNNLDPPQPQ